METTDILHLENNPNNIELTLIALKKQKLANHILTIKDGEETLEYIHCTGRFANRDQLKKPKDILLNLKLPKAEGFKILKRLTSNHLTKTISVAIRNPLCVESDVIEREKHGVNSYVGKPINFSQFTNAVASLGVY